MSDEMTIYDPDLADVIWKMQIANGIFTRVRAEGHDDEFEYWAIEIKTPIPPKESR